MTSGNAYAAIEAAFASDETREAVSRLSDDQRALLHQYWLDRAEGELTTALSFEFMLDDLRTEGAPRALFELAERSISEEHLHTDWCLRWAKRIDPTAKAEAHFGGTRPASFEGASEHDDRLLRTVFGGLSETVAVHVLRRSHAAITLPSVRSLNRQHLEEEVFHARLGWALLAWPELPSRDRGMIGAHVPEMLKLLRDVWLLTDRPSEEHLEALGFLSTPLVAAAIDEAVDLVILPGLVHHHIG